MDWLLVLVVLYLFGSIFNRSKGTKPQERPQNTGHQETPTELEDILQGKIPFEIPDLEGAPVDRQGNKVPTENELHVEKNSDQEKLERIIEEQQRLIKRAEKIKHYKEMDAEPAAASNIKQKRSSKGLIPDLKGRSALQRAIVYSEILGKPKSLQ